MRKLTNINQDWSFIKDGVMETVNLPHTWNAIDGQGGAEGPYYRGRCVYEKTLPGYEGRTYIEITGAPESYFKISEYLEKNGYTTVEAEIKMVSQNMITLEGDELAKFKRLVDALEDLDDVQSVYHNVDLPEEDED